ncbi:MAG: hypothetical protein QM504_18860 [Pseudomonadota bacterium]
MIMILNVSITGNLLTIEVPQDLISSASELFLKMDADMNNGWTMGREYIDHPNLEQRCQIIADKLLTAIDNEDEQLKIMMAAYILSRVPNIMTLHIDNTGDMNESWLDLAPE